MTGNSQSNGSSNLEIAQSNQDLIMTKGKRKKRTWIMAGVACVIVLALLIAAIVLLANERGKEADEPEEAALSLEDIIHGKVYPNTFNASWVGDKELMYIDHAGNLVLRDLDTEAVEILIDAKDEILTGASEFHLSADRLYLRIRHSSVKIYRHSYRARYTFLDLRTKEKTPLELSGNMEFLLVQWGPQGNSFAFVLENNIYYRSSVNSLSQQLTSDPNFVYNGIPDWVYEEEVFSSNVALWFSPDGNKLAFAKFDDRNTPIMVLPIYGEPGALEWQYPRAQVIRYPKAGTTNPSVSLHYVELNDTSSVKRLDPPANLAPLQPILTAVVWANHEDICAVWMNRVQNRASILSYSTAGAGNTVVVKSWTQPSGWLELFTPPLFSKDGLAFVLILSQRLANSQDSFRHVTLLTREENSEEEPLTSGPFVVTEILGWNPNTNQVYYLANTVNDSAVQHLYSVIADTKEVTCISCGIKSQNAKTSCSYNTADFNKQATHYALTCAGPDIPDVAIYSYDRKILDWEDNPDLRKLLSAKRIPRLRRMTFEVDGGFKAQVSLKVPPNFDESGNTKYPMLVNVYAGPDSFQVIDRFNLDWGSYLASNKSIIYATIDGRGSGLKGDKMLFASYRQLGTVEIVDQANVTRQIQEALPYVDASRTAIWGWSYGGYASGMVLANDQEGVFKCGISVAPVTDWTLYDSIYTERFMGLPTINDNYQGYRNASLLTKYEGLRDKEYFLIHGTYDDNVHYQQSMLWAKVLEQNDILFRQLSYPDEDHGLGSVRPHLYHSLEEFLDECFVVKA